MEEFVVHATFLYNQERKTNIRLRQIEAGSCKGTLSHPVEQPSKES